MKKLFFTFLFFSLILGSCGNDEEASNETQQNKVPEDAKIEEVTSTTNNTETIKSKQETEPQLSPDFKEFVNKFPHATLPYELKPDFENYDEEIYAKIPLEQQIKYLAKAEKLQKTDFEEMAEYTDFYFVSNPVQTNEFTAIVYGRFEMGSVYFYLCTFDNHANYISSIDFAAFEMLGAGPQAGQYTITTGKIDKNYKITVHFDDLDGYTSEEHYQIKSSGKIIKL